MSNKTHVLVFPLPAQGHLNPMVQFAKRLASQGHKLTLLLSNSRRQTIQLQPLCSSYINVETVPDTFAETEDSKTAPRDGFYRYLAALEKGLPKTITEMQQRHSSQPPKVLVYDAAMPWALGIAHGLGLKGGAFFTQTCTVTAIFHHFQQGNLKIPPPEEEDEMVSSWRLPGVPPLERKDLPSFISDRDTPPMLTSLAIDQLSNLETADWVFFNTFDLLEQEVVNWMQNQWNNIKTIGPTVPSQYLDQRLKDDNDYGIVFNRSAEACLNWLDQREKGSVVYVSFGSVTNLTKQQIEELAWGLEDSNSNFLWVLRETEKSQLPVNNNSMGKKGLVVKWCPQLEVLSHQSIGCFVTHCGWNSTIEALSLGVPMVAMPQWTDQRTNAKFISDVWKVGVRVQVNDGGGITRKEIENGIKEVTEGKRGDEIRRNALRWKELAKEAVVQGGSSDKNISEFLSEVSQG